MPVGNLGAATVTFTVAAAVLPVTASEAPAAKFQHFYVRKGSNLGLNPESSKLMCQVFMKL